MYYNYNALCPRLFLLAVDGNSTVIRQWDRQAFIQDIASNPMMRDTVLLYVTTNHDHVYVYTRVCVCMCMYGMYGMNVMYVYIVYIKSIVCIASMYSMYSMSSVYKSYNWPVNRWIRPRVIRTVAEQFNTREELELVGII